MSLKETQIGVAFTGSFCTYKKAFLELQKLSNCCGSVQTVFSTAAASTDSRFGSAESFYRRAEEITGNKPMMTISEAEPIGPKNLFDALVILPCTGNTLAKLANGITDTPALMAAKAHLRNNKPLLLIFIDKRRPRYEYEKLSDFFLKSEKISTLFRSGRMIPKKSRIQ